jgi:hypothetical protein
MVTVKNWLGNDLSKLRNVACDFSKNLVLTTFPMTDTFSAI